MLHGTAVAVTDADEKLYAMRLITEQVLRGRWEGTRVPPTKAELDSTAVLRVAIAAASAKVRTGPPNDAIADVQDAAVAGTVWTGVVPTWTTHGEPVPSGSVRDVPVHVRAAVEERNRTARKSAEDAVIKAPAKE